MKKRKMYYSTTHLIMLSFLMVIILGSILLSLPISSARGDPVEYIDALFTATTSVCVTGLVTLPTVTTWSIFGQVVILVLIQIGGLGIVTIVSAIMIGMNRRLGLKIRILLQDAFNLNSISGVVVFLKKVVIGTFLVEGIGALLYMTVFIPRYGVRGIWISVFNSISAFCNAGIDVMSENSLCEYATNPMINITTSMLVILGGIGYVVWWDVIRVAKNFRSLKLKCFSRLFLHSKIALSATGILLLAGAVLFFVFEYNNPLTLKDYSLFDKIQIAVFQSMTTRTAGFASIPQENLTNASSVVSLMLMFIGGSPVGTAGGVKTVTFVVVIFAALSAIKNEDEVKMFSRGIEKTAISKAAAVITVSFMIMFISTVLLSAVSDANILDIAYETVSATATVGLTRNFTPSLNIWGKIIIITTMYLGRVGPISLLIAFNLKMKKKNIITVPVEQISIG